MDYVQLLNELKTSSDYDVKAFASSYGIDLTTSEIRALRPLLDEVSFHWIFTGIPEVFIKKVRIAIGDRKAEQLLKMYFDAKQ
jgi:hypothetical protein